MICEVRLVKLDAIPAEIPRVDLAERCRQISDRSRAFALRTSAKGWSDAA
jgi:hypothetical protein